MYDCLHLRFTLPQAEPGYAVFQDSLALRQGTLTRQEHTRWQLRYHGLRLDYWPCTGRGRIRGSLHTFFHGHNSGSFLAKEVPAACQLLADTFGLPAQTLIIEHLEVGINLPLPVAPTAFLDTMLAHKGSPFYPQEPPAGTTRPLLFVAAHLDYRVKAYDKGKYNRVKSLQIRHAPPHLLRFEVVYTRSRPLQRLLQCPILTLEDIAQPAAVQKITQALRQHWYSVEHGFEPDFSGLAFPDMLLLHAATAPALWKASRQCVPARTLTRHRARSRHLRQQAELSSSLSTYHQCFEQQLTCLLAEAEGLEAAVETNSAASDGSIQTSRLGSMLWPNFHPCNQVESSPVAKEVCHAMHPTQPAPSPLRPAPTQSIPHVDHTADITITARFTFTTKALSDNLTISVPHLAGHLRPALPYLSTPLQPNSTSHKIALNQPTRPAHQAYHPAGNDNMQLLLPANNLLFCRHLCQNVAINRVRPPPTCLNYPNSRLRLCYRCCCQVGL